MAVYEEYQPHPRWRAAHVYDVVPWRAVVAPGVVLQKYRHGLQRTYAVRGPDVMGLAREVQGSLILQANTVLKRLGGHWMLQSEAQRMRVTALPDLQPRFPLVTEFCTFVISCSSVAYGRALF